MEFKSVLKGNRGRTPASENAKDELSMSTYINKQDNTSKISLYVGINILKKARIIVGDRVDLLKSDCGKYGMLKRVLSGGLKIGYSGGKSGSKNIAKIQTINNEIVNITKKVVLQNVVIDEEGILFDWPQGDNK